jgi:hypothetical protein
MKEIKYGTIVYCVWLSVRTLVILFYFGSGSGMIFPGPDPDPPRQKFLIRPDPDPHNTDSWPGWSDPRFIVPEV